MQTLSRNSQESPASTPRKTDLNAMFSNLCWSHGRDPYMLLNGEIRKLDVVASTILSGSLTNICSVKMKVHVKAYDAECETEDKAFARSEYKLISENSLSCWDLIDSVNELKFSPRSKQPNSLLQVTKIQLMDEENLHVRLDVMKYFPKTAKK